MSDSHGNPQQVQRGSNGNRDANRTGFRTGRGPNNREGGGFRIRLSENEMRAVRSLQETFGLRSTVAVLGFAIRTLAQLLEEGKLTDLLTEYKSQNPDTSFRKDQSGYNHQTRNSNRENQTSYSPKNQKANPFARPDKPINEIPEQTEVTPANETINHDEVKTEEVNSEPNQS